MANEEHLRIIEQGVRVWNRWREEHPEIQPDLSGWRAGPFKPDSKVYAYEITHKKSPKQGYLRQADFRGVNLDRADLSRTNLIEALFTGASLKDTFFEGAALNVAWLDEVDARGANFDEANVYRASFRAANLKGASFRSAHLWGAVFSEADLAEADLRWASIGSSELLWADPTYASFVKANLNKANLRKTNLSEADLSDANLSEANLVQANLNSANLDGVNLSRAIMGGTILGNNDLNKVRGTETVTHQGPSTIGLDTIYKSKGKIPEVFLRGCGVPEPMITYMASLVGKPIQYYSCFISYSSKDHECAERLHADLQNKGVRCWFAPEDMKTGDKILDRIDREIRVYDKLLLIFSEHSIASDWVETEVHKALDKERHTKKTVLFPIRLDSAVMETDQAWAANVRRERHITDFRGWKNHDAYQMQFARLLRDLQAVDAQEVVEPIQPSRPESQPTENYRTQLRKNLVGLFSNSELRDLCFDVNVDYESLRGENKADKARELITYCERRAIMSSLVARCRELRPNASWE